MKVNSRFSIILVPLFLLIISLVGLGFTNKKIQVACIGDSITFGARLTFQDEDSYPAQLQTLLGEDFQVHNLGVGGCTLIRKGSPTVWTSCPK